MIVIENNVRNKWFSAIEMKFVTKLETTKLCDIFCCAVSIQN